MPKGRRKSSMRAGAKRTTVRRTTRRTSSTKNYAADQARKKLRATIKRLAQVKREFNRKLKTQSIEFKRKVKLIEAKAIANAIAQAQREHAKKELARKKLLAAVEAKFVKGFKASGKKTGKRRGTTSFKAHKTTRARSTRSIRAGAGRKIGTAYRGSRRSFSRAKAAQFVHAA